MSGVPPTNVIFIKDAELLPEPRHLEKLLL